MAERIVVVGVGAITCLGRDLDSTWANLIAGATGLKRREALDPSVYRVSIAGMVENFGPGSDDSDPELSRLPARSIHLGVAAARAALADAGLAPNGGGGYDPHRVAIAVGSGFGGVDFLEAESARMATRKKRNVSPFLVPSLLINLINGQIAEQLGVYGPSVAPANACSAGAHAIAMAAGMLRAGSADLALCGGAESAFTPPIVNAFATMRALFDRGEGDRGFDDPGQASRPFSADRAGFVMSEGAAILLLATESAARRLNLSPRAELAGWALNTDGHHISMPEPDRIARCITLALEHSSTRSDQVDYYNAHGTSTPVNDRVETGAVQQVFGEFARRLPVSSIKGAVGHALGAAPAIEAAVCVCALREQVIPPTINYQPDPELGLDYVPERGRPAELETVMSASFGFGGTNGVLVFRRWPGA